MDSFEWNKVAGAILSAILLVYVVDVAANSLLRVETLEENVYVVGVKEAEEEAVEEAVESAPTEPTAAEAAGALALLASIDAAAAEKAAGVCKACHSFDKDGPNKVGPNLWGILGAAKASKPGYKYSAALAGLGGAWSYMDLDAYLVAPKDFVPGTKMSFGGVKKTNARAAVIAFLRSLSDDPIPLP